MNVLRQSETSQSVRCLAQLMHFLRRVVFVPRRSRCYSVSDDFAEDGVLLVLTSECTRASSGSRCLARLP